MHWRLFFTIVAATVTAFCIIRWLQHRLDVTQTIKTFESRREIGFAALMKEHATNQT
jgi:hypothetical protein